MASVSSEDHLSSLDLDEEPLAEMTDEELFNLVEETMKANEALQIETNMFESFLRRVEPKDSSLQTINSASQGVGAALESSTQQQTQHQQQQQQRTSFRKRSRSRGQSMDKNVKLSAEQKCDIATRELEEMKESIEMLKDNAEKKLNTYRAVMEEAEIRLGEVKKAQYEFNRDIVNGAVNPRSNKIIAEKLTRSIEDKLRARDTLIKKLRLKNSTLKVQKKKLQLQLKQKEEMGEVLHEVDFNQLKIENSQYLEKIDEKNQELLGLKSKATNVLQVLNTYKEKLHVLTMESDRLKSEIGQRKDLLRKIGLEMDLVEREKSEAEDANKKYQQQLQDYKVPDVMEYVEEKAQLYNLHKAVQSWERKVEIAQMALKTHQNTWAKMKADAGQENNIHKGGVQSASWSHPPPSLVLT